MKYRSNLNRLRVTVSLSAIAVIVAFGHGCNRSDGPSSDDGDSGDEVVAYRLPTLKSMHFDDPASATEHMKAVRKLGCEAWQEDHGGHIDIVYRCPQWMRVLIASRDTAIKKLDWLEAAGFDTHHSHLNETFVEGNESLEIRLEEWRTMHLDGLDEVKTNEVLETLRGVSAAVLSERHEGHMDVKFRCPISTTVRVADREAADKIHELLKEFGFEVKRAR